MPRPATFARLVDRLTGEDPGNLWNVPVVAAALRADPNSNDLKRRWQAFSDLKAPQTQNYRIGVPDYEGRVRRLLTADILDSSRAELDYPRVLFW